MRWVALPVCAAAIVLIVARFKPHSHVMGKLQAKSPTSPTSRVCRLAALQYTHVEDTRTTEVITLMGPLVFPLKRYHRMLHAEPLSCIVVPPNHYVQIGNPVRRDGPERSASARDDPGYQLICSDSTRLRRPSACSAKLGAHEIRFVQPPFPLFPGEVLEQRPKKQPLLAANTALLLRCRADYTYTVNGSTRHRKQGDMYYHYGPGLYSPRVEEYVVRVVCACILSPSKAAYLTATEALLEECEDATGRKVVARCAGEQWTVRGEGAYFPPPNASVDAVVDAIPLPEGTGLWVHAQADFKDTYTGKLRRAGEEWLVTRASVGAAYVPSHLETVRAHMKQVVLGRQQYCVICNPTESVAGSPGGGGDGTEGGLAALTTRPRWGARELRVGPCSFFLDNAHSMLEGGVKDVFTLTEDEALLVQAAQPFTDADAGVERVTASRWLVCGPRSYIPPLQVRVLERRRVITLSPNEGVYVRNTRTGETRRVHGKPFMLSEDEELWEKPVSRYIRRLMEAPRLCIRVQEEPCIAHDWELSTQRDVEAMLGASAGLLPSPRLIDADGSGKRSGREVSEDLWDGVVREQPTDIRRYSVVSVDVEQNTLLRLQDTHSGTSRVVAGPAAVSLEPYEEFTSITLSGGRPKQPHQIHTLSLFLGPDYMSDVIEVETLDHARLKLELAYNWEFDSSDMDGTLRRVFTLPDFVGEACKTLASRVRVAIASTTFESFHRNSASVTKQAIFSAAADGSTELRGDCLYFLVNGLRITNVDLQSVEPVDPNTRAALTKSVQLAVEILTKSQESLATHHAARIEEEARGALDLQVVRDKATAEKERVKLVEVVVNNTTMEQGNTSKVQAVAESEARLVEAQAELDATPLRCAAHEVGVDTELDILQRRMEADLAHRQALNELLKERAASLAEIEAVKYEAIMAALEQGTVVAIAQAGPELKAQMLAALGLQGFLVTDGSSPVNLMDVAQRITAGRPSS